MAFSSIDDFFDKILGQNRLPAEEAALQRLIQLMSQAGFSNQEITDAATDFITGIRMAKITSMQEAVDESEKFYAKYRPIEAELRERQAAKADADLAEKARQEALLRTGEGVRVPFGVVDKADIREGLIRTAEVTDIGRFNIDVGVGRITLGSEVEQRTLINDFIKEYNRIISMLRNGQGTSSDVRNLKNMKAQVEGIGISRNVLNDLRALSSTVSKEPRVVRDPGSDKFRVIPSQGETNAALTKKVTSDIGTGVKKTIGGTAEFLTHRSVSAPGNIDVARERLMQGGLVRKGMGEGMPSGMTGIKTLAPDQRSYSMFTGPGERISPSQVNSTEATSRQLGKMLPERSYGESMPPIARTGRLRLPGTSEGFQREFGVSSVDQTPARSGRIRFPGTTDEFEREFGLLASEQSEPTELGYTTSPIVTPRKRIISPTAKIPGIKQVLGLT